MRSWGWAGIAGASAAVVVITAGVLVAAPWSTDTASRFPGSSPSASALTGVCGFEGPLVNAIAADRPKDEPAPEPQSWRIADRETPALGMWTTSDGIAVERQSEKGLVIESFGLDGKPRGTTTATFDIPADDTLHNNGSAGVGADGSIYAIDSYNGNRDLVRFDPNGGRAWSKAVPESDESTGHPLDLTGATWVADFEGSAAILVTEGEQTMHVFREDGLLVDTRRSPSAQLAGADGSVLFGVEQDDDGLTLIGTEGGGTRVLQVAMAAPPSEDSAAATTPSIARPSGFAVGPGGEGFLALNERGIEWFDANGVRLGVWLYTGGSPTQEMVHRDGQYWMVVDAEEDQRLVVVTEDEMRELLSSPVDPNASNEADNAMLGLGIGAVTPATLNHFDEGETPQVALRAEDGWGELTPDLADRYEVRYRVSGDPRLATAVEGTTGTVGIPVGGGEVPLELPAALPGPYEVSLSLVERSSGDPVSGACLRYSVGAAGTDLDLESLADGAGWGGADPLRGIQLADRLGVGSHRVQLDFGSLISDPESAPSADGVEWMALPGATQPEDGSAPADSRSAGFAQLRAAADFAQKNGVDLIVQVGSGGEAEKAAVDAGTWAGWTSVLVAAFAAEAPGVTLWEAWNEPNNSFGEGADYATRVEIPFANAAHATNPAVQVLAGNTLGLDEAWWTDAVGAGICGAVDAIAVHPYTGWNRSWEEEGFHLAGQGIDSLREALGPECADLPIWDTETGWTADGAAAYWAQGSNVARKLMWYSQEELAGWTYFFSEGGWGENELSWSLIQYESYVKPGALAFTTVSRLLEGRGAGESLETGIPNSHAMRFAGDDDLVAVWTDDMRIDAQVTSTARTLDVIDQYGGTSELALDEGRASLPLSGAPTFLRAPEGATIVIEPVAAFGTDVLADQPVKASTTHVDSDPEIITSGTVNPYRPWRTGRTDDDEVDEAPTVEITLDAPERIDRIAVASGSIVCCEAGLRNYTVSVKDAAGDWQVVATQENQFWDRVVLFSFPAVEATAVRVEVPWTTIRDTKVPDVNYTGFAGGLPPPFMGLQSESDYVVSIAAVQAWKAAGS